MKVTLFLSTLLGGFILLLAGCAGTPSGETYRPAIDARDFVAAIDNPFLPLTPGTRFVYENVTDRGTERTEVSVLAETVNILGVDCTVVRDTVRLNGGLVEDTRDWFAQDRQGNVWYFGEDTRDYRDGEVVGTAGAWKAGVDGARPGIVMKADPQPGDSYRQEYYPGRAEDMAEVIALDEEVTVPFGTFTGCLKTIEWNPLEPGVAEYKYYAPGVGLVLVTERGSAGREVLLQAGLEG